MPAKEEHGAACRRAVLLVRRKVNSPDGFASVVIAQGAANAFRNRQFAKAGSVFRPAHGPGGGGNEIPLVPAVPAFDRSLDKENVEESSN